MKPFSTNRLGLRGEGNKQWGKSVKKETEKKGKKIEMIEREKQ